MGDIQTPNQDALRSTGFPSSGTSTIPSAGPYETRLLGWAKDALNEGEGLLKRESESEDVDENIRLVMGEFSKLKVEREKPSYRANHTQSRLAKNINDIASALTDFRPTGEYRTFNPNYEGQGIILGKLFDSWYYSIQADLKIQMVVKQSLVARTGYAHLVYDPTMWNGLGDVDIIPKDYRDIVPIRPNSKLSIQDAVGVIIKSRATVNWGRQRYPGKADLIHPVSDSSFASSLNSEFRVGSPALNYLEQQKGQTRDFSIPSYNHYEIYVRDNSINKSSSKVWVGPAPEGQSPWGYWVEPKEPLYPRGRLIVIANMDVILWDGPNPYWHGMFPLIKLTLDPWPWSLLGKSVIQDVKQTILNDNELYQGITDAARKALRPGIIADKNVAPRAVIERLDTREPGFKLLTNPALGNGIVIEEPVRLPEYILQTRAENKEFIDYTMGILDMRALAQMQSPSLTTDVETLLESVGPAVRTKGRMLETFVREMATMMKGNFLQFWSQKRRIQILGRDGLDMTEYDFDPDSLVPDFSSSLSSLTDDEKKKFYDVDGVKSRAQRALIHQHNFSYYIVPNSLLNLSKAKNQLINLQLFRMGMLDPWTLWESLEVPNAGEPPNGEATITERMQAAANAGLNPAVSAAGRKSSGQDMPRIKISESG